MAAPFEISDLSYSLVAASKQIPPNHAVRFALENLTQDCYPANQPIYVDASDPSNFIDAETAKARILNLAAGLIHHGVLEGECVCVHSYNHIEYPTLWLGVLAAGAIATGTNPAYTASEIVHHLKTTSAKYVIVHVDCLDAVEIAIQEYNVPKQNIFIFGCGDPSSKAGYTSCGMLQDAGSRLGPELYDTLSTFDRSATTPAVYAATSGTTGLPKAAVLSHQHLISQAINLEELYVDSSNGSRDDVRDSVRQLISLPVFHSFASQLAFILPLRLGITTYFLPRFDLVKWVDAIESNKITDCPVVPPIIAALMKLDEHGFDKLQSLRYVVCAGSAMNPVLQEDFALKLHEDAVVAQCWGTTEIGWTSVFNRGERDFTGSVGRLMHNTMLKIVDEDCHVIADDGVAGEAYIKTPAMFLGYRNSAAEISSGKDEQGFASTGDSVYKRNGKIYIDGRIKDIMKVNGWQVSPEELQNVIMGLADRGVADCAVSGLTTVAENGLENTKPRAYIVLAPGSELAEVDIKNYVASKLISYKHLTGGIAFVEKVPRNATGKILRRLLPFQPVVGRPQKAG